MRFTGWKLKLREVKVHVTQQVSSEAEIGSLSLLLASTLAGCVEKHYRCVRWFHGQQVFGNKCQRESLVYKWIMCVTSYGISHVPLSHITVIS